MLRFKPSALGARKVRGVRTSDFGRIALAGHADAARGEMHSLAKRFLEFAGDGAGDDLRKLLELI